MRRYQYNKGVLDEALRAAQKTSCMQSPRFVFATAYGWAVSKNRPPRGQSFYKVVYDSVSCVQSDLGLVGGPVSS